MKHFRLSVDGKPYEIEILNDPRAEEVLLKIDGIEMTVNAENLDADVPAAAVVASTPAVSAPVTAPVRAAAAPVAAAPVAVTADANTVKAPLPGVINAVKVREGQTVKQNDPLVVIEAMKAMNVIRAQRSGTVTKIFVSNGSRVAYGSALLDIE
ncbi:acetyl-CoA carboxylase biotin carboxyl carrier protein subunit [bacterium]|nr:acetyl-CoA carboxylase biotin carboxyl carrier protein subunit [bacterium]